MDAFNDFEVFLKGSMVDDVVEYEASNRFEANGQIVPWKLKPISAELNNQIRKECTKIPKKKNATPVLDEVEYIAKLCVASIVYPNLNSADFQDAVGVKTPQGVLKNILLPGEYDRLQAKVLEINGYGFTMDELIENAKN